MDLFRTEIEGKTAALEAHRASEQEIQTLEAMLNQVEQMNTRGERRMGKFPGFRS